MSRGGQITLILAVLVGLIGTVWYKKRPTLAERRAQVIKDAPRFPKGQVLLIGDSITEAENIPELCGLKVFNAGIRGTRVEHWLKLAPWLVRTTEPKIVIFALGTNNAATAHPFNLPVWAKEYRGIRPAGSYVVGLWPVEEAKNPVYSQARVALMNSVLSNEPHYVKPPVVPMTWDGVHLTRQGQLLWAANLQSICRI
jgi:lysophospholipase L1-like esterase